MRVLLRREVLGSVGCAGRQGVFVDEEVRCRSFIKVSPACSQRPLHCLLIGLDLPHGLHEIDALGQQIGLLACFGDVCEVLIKLFEVSCKIHILSFLGQVYEKIQDPGLTLAIECLLQILLHRCRNLMRSSEILGVPLGIRLLGLDCSVLLRLAIGAILLMIAVSVGEQFVEELD